MGVGDHVPATVCRRDLPNLLKIKRLFFLLFLFFFFFFFSEIRSIEHGLNSLSNWYFNFFFLMC